MSYAHENPTHGRIGDELEQIQRHADSDGCSNRRLMDEMEKMLSQETDEDFNADRLDQLLAELDAVDPIPTDAAAFDAEAGLKRFHDRQAVQQADEGEPTAARSFDSSASHHPKHRTYKVALIAAALISLLFVTTVQAAHLNIFDLIARWTSELFSFEATKTEVAEITRNPLARGEERTYDSIQEMLDEFGVTAPLFPTWVPERFGEPEVYARSVLSGLKLYADYSANGEELHIYAFVIDQGNTRDTEIREGNENLSVINGTDYYFVSDILAEKVVWQNGCFECRIYGNVTIGELEQIVSSIKKG